MKFRLIFFALLFAVLMITNLIGLGFFIAKYLYLKRIEFEIPLDNIDYVYFGLTVITFLKDVMLTCAIFRGSLNVLNPRQQFITLSLLLITWAIISGK
ncbi:hypothetical protein C1645_242509 [Glomus cerebriforme]|uniref:Uncharacterized protein n=1 Tax=Glomus cerebriforme TaxID=658196 RepID=A0A397SQR9_9GLOM|nr:hypothetical protein C1645_242509 [Glomus cerebriforme]